MSESEGQRNDSPLLSERGVTTISDTVVSQLAGMAAQEVEGVHMGGGTTRTASGVLGSITGSESKTSGISVEVGRTETAIDLKMGIEYNRNILQTVEEVRQRITDRVVSLTGLRIKELNATITDITFPEQETRRRLGPMSPTTDRESDPEQPTATAPEAQEAPEETQATPEAETSDPDERETTQVETTQVEATSSTPDEDSSAIEEEAGVEDRPPEEDETTEVPAAEATTEQPVEEEASETVETAETDETTEVPTEAEPPEPETPEARMRRRAEERARRRRRRSEDA